MDLHRPVGRPKGTDSKTKTICVRYTEPYELIIQSAMDEFGVSKSEAIRKIILEWNMLRYTED